MEYVLEMYPELAVGGRQASTLETLVFDSLCPDARIRGPVEKESQGTERVIHAVSRGRKHDAPKDEAVESLSVVRSRKHFRHLCRPDAAAPLEHRPGDSSSSVRVPISEQQPSLPCATASSSWRSNTVWIGS